MSRNRNGENLQCDTAQRMLQFIADNPGASVEDIADAYSRSTSNIGQYLTTARAAGLVNFVRVCRAGIRWWPAEAMPAAIEAEKQRRLARRRARNAWHAGWLRERRATLAATEDDDMSDQPIQRTVDASAPLPFVCKAPASVFHLGGML